MIRHFPAPPRLTVTIGGRPHRLKYLTRADVSALVSSLRDLCGGIPDDPGAARAALLDHRKVLDPLLLEAFPTAESIPSEDAEIKAGLLVILWEANGVSEILADLRNNAEEGFSEEEDPLRWPKFCLHMRRVFGVDEQTMFHVWTYWQFAGFVEAANAILSGERSNQSRRKMTVEELMEAGIVGGG